MKAKTLTRTQSRLKNVIESDRLSFTASSLDLIIKDISDVLSDYFRLTDKPKVNISSQGETYRILIEADCDALKAFGAVR